MSSFWHQLFGAFLATFGGYLAVVLRIRIERRIEINHIKISLKDELNEVCETIAKLVETHTTTQIISNSYFTDLSKNTDSFNFHKQRLFLISKEELRKEIFNFYKKLDKNITDSVNRVGQLGQTGSAHTAEIVQNFRTISTECSTLNDKISKFKYKVFLLF